MITQEQRQQRRIGIGSSDTAKIMHLHPFGDPAEAERQVYWSKICETLPPDEPTPEMREGNRQEAVALQWAADELGVQIITDPDKLFCVAQHGPGAGLLLANLDALIEGDPDSAVEAKWRNGEQAKLFGESGTDHVAYDVLIQTQHQMYCKELSRVFVSLATPHHYGIERKLFIVKRDEIIIDAIIKEDVPWWARHIKTKTPPDGQTTPPLYVLKALERREGVQIRLPDEAVKWVDDRISLKENIKALEASVEDIDAKLIHALGDAEIGLLPGDSRKVTFKTYEKESLDGKRLKLERPEIAAEYIVKTRTNTGVRISNHKK